MRNLTLVLAGALFLACPGNGPSGGGGGGQAGGGSGGGQAGGGAGGGTGNDAGQPIPLDAYCARSLEAACSFEQRCGEAAPGIDCRKLNELSRLRLHNTAHQDCLWAKRSGLDAGTIRYDAERAAACFASAQSSPCNLSFALDAVLCATVFVGTAAGGDACDYFTPCAAGLFCNMSTASCPGICQPQVPAGGEAPNAGSCAPGTFRQGRPDGGGYCYTPPPSGAPCGAFAMLPLVCAGENTCLAAPDGGQTCQPFKTAGQPTSFFELNSCALNLTVTQVADGGQECLPLGKTGDACGSAGLAACQNGLACTGGMCGPLVGTGGTCAADSDCVFGDGCKSGSCAPWGGVNDACTKDMFSNDCGQGLFCDSTLHCQAPGGLGAACMSYYECNADLGLRCVMVDAGQQACETASRCTPQ